MHVFPENGVLLTIVTKKITNKVVLYLSKHHGFKPTHTSEGEPNTLYVRGVSTTILSERKCYMLLNVGVGSPVPFQEVESFSYTSYGAPMLF